jgi:ATP-dependent DNA helicase DinG
VARLRDDFSVVCVERESHVTWVESRGARFAVGASPVEVGAVLRAKLFERGGSTVFTSATLGTGEEKSGPFAFFRDRIGIDFPALELRVPSPFDYPRQAALYLPSHLPDPRDPAYAQAAADEIVSLIELLGGGAFVLCTALASMQRLHALVAPRLRRTPLVQGMAPKSELLATFKAREDGVLFASASFWEGVDVPGSALRLVIIDKLPFEVPSDPLVQARCERLKQRGESPFMRYLVPSAALALKQGFGRLIRTETDRGVVAVLDPRLTTKPYGRVLLRSLPDASRCYSLAEIAAFWGERSERVDDASSQ